MVIHIFLVVLIALIVLMCVTAIIYLYYKRSLVQKALDDAWSRMSVQSLEAEHRTQLTLRISSIVGSNLEQQSILPQILDLLSRHFSYATLRLVIYREHDSFALIRPESSDDEILELAGLLDIVCQTGVIHLDEPLAQALHVPVSDGRYLFNLPIVHGDRFAGSLIISATKDLSIPDQRFLRDLVPALTAALRNHSLTDRFGRAVDSRVRDYLMSYSVYPAGEIREAGILFVDLVGFTAQAERLSPESIVSFLNIFFSRCQEIIGRRGGIINKFLGDGFMAMFGAPVSDSYFARHLLEAANDILCSEPELAQIALSYGIEKFGIALGAEIGQVLAGTIGSDSRLEYTLMGDVVNIASRLEGLTRFFGVTFLVGENLAKSETQWYFRNLGKIRPKGKKRALSIYESLGPDECIHDDLVTRAKIFEKGMLEYQNRNFESALFIWETLPSDSSDQALHWYQQQAREYIASPPAPSWDGTENFRIK